MGNFEKIKSAWVNASEVIHEKNLDTLEHYGRLLGYNGDKSSLTLLAGRIRDYGLSESIDPVEVDELLHWFEVADVLYRIVKFGESLGTPQLIEVLNIALKVDALTPLAIYVSTYVGLDTSVIEHVVDGGELVEEQPEETTIVAPAIETPELPPYFELLDDSNVVETVFNANVITTAYNVNKVAKLYSVTNTSKLIMLHNEATMATFIEHVVTYPEYVAENIFLTGVAGIVFDMINRSDFKFDKPLIFLSKECCSEDNRVFVKETDISFSNSSMRQATLQTKSYSFSGTKMTFPKVNYRRGVQVDKIGTSYVLYLL